LEFFAEAYFHDSSWPVSLLGDNDLCQPVIWRPLKVLLILDPAGPMKKEHGVSVLLD